MLLDIRDRLLILSVLPNEGNILTIRILRDLKNALSFTEEEIKEHGIKEAAEGFTTWNAPYSKDIAIGEKATDIIKDVLKAKSDSRKLSIEMIDLYERFVETK